MAYTHDLASGSAGGISIQRTTPIECAHNVLEQVRDLAARVETLATRLCGPVPEMAATSKGSASLNDGLLDGLRNHAESVANRISAAHDALNRIDQQL